MSGRIRASRDAIAEARIRALAAALVAASPCPRPLRTADLADSVIQQQSRTSSASIGWSKLPPSDRCSQGNRYDAPGMASKKRADWDTYFLELAKQAATRSSCRLNQHGAVIVSNRRIQATGYNGTPSGFGNCDGGACPRGKTGDLSLPCAGLHAEANAILYAAPEDREGATLYVTGVPCFECAKLIANSGLREIVALEDGSLDTMETVRKFLLDCKVMVRVLKSA